MSRWLSFLATLPPKQWGKAGTGLRAIWARTRLVTIAFACFGLILATVGLWRAVNTYYTIKKEERLRAHAAALQVANRLSLILSERFADLRFLGQSLIGSQPAGSGLDAPTKNTLRAFLATHAMLRDINILNARGSRILWSALPQPTSRPLISAEQFQTIRDDPRFEIGKPVYARRFRATVVPLRYRITGRGGATRFLIGDPANLGRVPLFAARSHLAIRLATRGGQPFAAARDGLWRALPAPLPLTDHVMRADVPSYPWKVEAFWSGKHLWALWWHHTTHWLPLFLLILWGSQYTGLLLANLLSQEMQLRLWHEGLSHLNQESAKGSPPEDLFRDAAHIIQDNLDASFVFVGWRDRCAVASPTQTTAPSGLLEAAFDQAVDSDWRRVAQEAFPTCMALALGTTGAVIVACPSRRAQTVIWYGMARELAGHLTATIDRVRQRQEIERLQHYQAAVRLMQLELLRQPTPDEAQSLLVRILIEQTDIMGAFIAVPEATGPRLSIRAAAAAHPEIRDALLRLTPSRDISDTPFGQMLAGRAFRSGTAHGPIDPHDNPALRAVMADEALQPVRAVLAYPIIEEGEKQPVAALAVMSADPGYFTPDLRALLEDLVASVRLALSAWRTRRQTDRYHALYEALARASQAIARATEARPMFRNICQLLAECTDVPLAFISLLGPEGTEIAAAAGSGRSFLPDVSQGGNAWNHPLATLHERARRAGTSWLFESADQWLEDEALRDKAATLGLVTAFAVPWIRDSHVAGILGIVARDRTFFDEDMRRVLEALGNDIGYAVDNYERREGLMKLSLYDALTALPNRAYFERSTISAMARAQRSGQFMALGVMDLDGFKEWNDLQGHTAGDGLLKAVAQKLREVVREDEGVARLGGDEFALTAGLDSVDALAALSARLLAAIALADPQARVTASIGWAIHKPGTTSYGTLLTQADEALYAAKDAGRNTYRIFEGDIARRFARRLAIHKRFPAALAEGRILFALAPQAQCATGRIEGVELVARWRDDDETLTAQDFMPDVEKDPRLIRALGRRTLNEAVALRERLRASGHDLRVILSIGAHHFFHPAFLDEVTDTLGGRGAAGLCIALPIGMALTNVALATETMNALKALGFAITLEAFGAGYSPLTEAARLPADDIKLDRRLIGQLRRDPDVFPVVGSALLLAKLSGRPLIATGIETAVDLQLWRYMGGEHYQGRLLADPVGESDLPAWLAQASPSPVTAVPAFPSRDLVLAAYAFLEPDGYPDEAMRTGYARLEIWMRERGARYQGLSQWAALAAVLGRSGDHTTEGARAFWHHEAQPAIVGLFREIEAHLKTQQFGDR